MENNFIKRQIKMLAVALLALVFMPVTNINAADQQAQMVKPAHGIAMHNKLRYDNNYTSFDYVNPSAPKGGRISYGFTGTFDSLNPFVIKGTAARGLIDGWLGNLVFEPLMIRGRNEPFTLYGHIAKQITVPDDRSWVEFTLDPRARFSDNQPLTTKDVNFTYEFLKQSGQPRFRKNLTKIKSVEVKDEHTIKFNFIAGVDREAVMLLAMMPVLPSHVADSYDFSKTSLTPPIGSGPYVVTGVKPGTNIVFKRNKDYWAWGNPEIIGRFNFDEIKIEYFRDNNSLFEAFKKGIISVYPTSYPEQWLNGYDFPAAQKGKVVKHEFVTGLPKGMRGFIMNSRRRPLDNIKVREALTMLFDFEFTNEKLFNGLYERHTDYFTDSVLSAYGVKANAKEREILAKYPGLVRDDIMEGEYRVITKNDKKRATMRKALSLLQQAGYKNQNGQLVDSDGKQLSVEVLVANVYDGTEKAALVFKENLADIGIELRLRQVDASQFWQRIKEFDFDMIDFRYTASLSPGIEQQFRWSSKAADTKGTFNFAGVKSKPLDELIQKIVEARNEDDFVNAIKAYDRALMSGFYVVPLFYNPKQWIGAWSYVKVPKTTPIFGARPDTWWYDKQ